MYFYDAHCDYRFASVSGRKTFLTPEAVRKAKLEKSVLAVFEGETPDRSRVFAQAAWTKTPVKHAFCAFEGLGWVESEDDIAWIRSQKPVYVGPVWNHKNRFGGSCYDDAPLTAWGKTELRRLVKDGAAVDLAHAGEQLFDSVCDAFDRVLVSHANVFELCAHPRNLRVRQIRRLIEKNAFLGLTFYVPFVGGDTLEKLFCHIEAVLELGGEDILGFGSDFDGCHELIENAADASLFARIAEETERRNYPPLLREKLAHGNLERVLIGT